MLPCFGITKICRTHHFLSYYCRQAITNADRAYPERDGQAEWVWLNAREASGEWSTILVVVVTKFV